VLLRSLLLVVTLAGACASPQVVTWSDVERDAPAPAPSTPAPRRTTAAPPRDAPEGPAAGVLIDRALQDFVSLRVTSKAHPKTSPVWAEAWDDVLERIAGACEIAPRASDLGAFVRARVTLEVELDRDMSRGLLLPDRLDQRVRAVLGAVDESVGELRAANAPGTLAPSPRLEEGELVLRAPLAPMIISSPFGVRADPFTGQRRFHAGVDLDAPEGTHVFASASGLVVYAGTQGGYGKQIVIDHGDGVRTHYSHLSEILVSPGQTVEEGDDIAYVGSTGRSTGPHLHFAVTDEGGDFLDPTALLDVPYSTIAQQVKVGPKNHKTTYAIKKSGDTVEISSVGASSHR
jgi:murein DD-endopeptidase MepM/ murein hydrolase activator NlpD